MPDDNTQCGRLQFKSRFYSQDTIPGTYGSPFFSQDVSDVYIHRAPSIVGVSDTLLAVGIHEVLGRHIVLNDIPAANARQLSSAN